MKTRFMLKRIITAMVIALTFANCTNDNELIEELAITREFSPVELTSIIRNQITVELNWTPEADVIDYYVVEVSEDPSYTPAVQTVNVNPNELPVQITLESETLYYIRVKAVSSRGLQDSNWSEITAQTLTEQLFYPIEPGDVQAVEALLRWVPNSQVTHMVIEPGSVTRNITAQENGRWDGNNYRPDRRN